MLVITESGTIIDVVPTTEDAEFYDGLLCPGFINAHCHLELSHMLGQVPERTGMTDFLMAVMFNRSAAPNTKLDAMQQAVAAMTQNGIVAVGDICNTADSIPVKLHSDLLFHNFIEVSGFVPATAASRFEQAVSVAKAFTNAMPAAGVSVTPHAPYSVSAKLFEHIAQISNILSVHNQESMDEDNFIRNKNGGLLRLYEALGVNIDFFEAAGSGSLAYMLPLLPAGGRILLVHNCHTTADDIAAIKQFNRLEVNDSTQPLQYRLQPFFCVCPGANLYIGNPLPDIALLLQSGYPVCVGTDSLASNHQLNILSELNILKSAYSFLSNEQLLMMATIHGARALGMEAVYGSFEKGKRPGVLQLRHFGHGGFADTTVMRII